MEKGPRVDAHTIAEIRREVEEEAKKGTPVVQLAPGGRTYPSKRIILLLQELQRAKGLSDAQRHLLRSLWRDLVRIAKARAGMMPVLIEGRERYAPLVVLTPVGGRTRVSDVNADEGSPHNAGSNTTLPARVQTRSRPPCPLLAEQKRRTDRQGARRLGQLSA